MIRLCLFAALLLLQAPSFASGNDKVMEYLDQLVTLRTNSQKEYETAEVKFVSGAADLKKAILPDLQKQLDQAFENNDVDSAILLKARLDAFNNYQPSIFFNWKNIKKDSPEYASEDFFNQLQVLRGVTADELLGIRSDFSKKANQFRDELIAELKAEVADAMSKRDLDGAIELRELIRSVKIPSLFLAFSDAAEIESDAVIQKFHEDDVNSVTFSPDGKFIVSASDDNTVVIWDAITGKKKFVRQTELDRMSSAAFSPDGLYIVCVANKWGEGNLSVWNRKTRKREHFGRYGGQVTSVAFSPDGKNIVSGCEDFYVRQHDARVMDSEAGHPRFRLNTRGFVASVAYSPDGKSIAATMSSFTYPQNHYLKILDAKTGNIKHTFKVLWGIKSISYSPDGDNILGIAGSRANVWDVNTGKEKFQLRALNGLRRVNSVSYSPDGKSILSGSDNRYIDIWDAQTGKLELTLKAKSTVKSVAYSPSGNTIVCGGGASGEVTIYTLKSDLSR